MGWLESNRDQALWLVPLLAFAEAAVGLGLFVSGVLLVTAATILYTQGLVDLPQIIALAWAGALLGDHSGFLTGRHFGPRFHHLRLAQRYRQNLLKAEAMVQRHGAAAIFIGRFVPAIRSVVPVLVGISGFARLRYLLVDALACLLWALALAAIVAGLDTMW
jgi:membrane-associated protein